MRIRTGFSFRSAVGMIDDVLDRLKEIGSETAPISDFSSTFAFNRWRKGSKKRGLRPIFGVELAVGEVIHEKKPIRDVWTFFAIDDIEKLNKLVTLATSQFHYTPCLTYEQAMAAEGVIKIAGSWSRLDLMQPAPDLFVSLSPSSSKGYLRRAKEAGFAFLACSDNRYVRKVDEEHPERSDKALYEIVCGRNASTQSYPQWILSEEEWREAVSFRASSDMIEEALSNRRIAEQRCVADLAIGELLKPPHPDTLENMCRAGAKKLGCDLDRPVYAERLKRELSLIAEKKFEDYFYIIADIVQWARKRMIVGPARGSSCGSLVCYLLEITTVDPIPYGLIFERFIDINRNDLPDIDIDFSDQRRSIVFDYVAKKYGSDRMARLGTVAVYKPKSAVSEAGAALSIPKWKCEAALESLIERSSGDSRALQALEDTFKDTPAGRKLIEDHPEILISARMEGHPRHHSQHAAGIILTEKPISHYVAIDSRTGGTHCDKKDAEDLNLLKIDALGLTQLSVFEDVISLIRDRPLSEHHPLMQKVITEWIAEQEAGEVEPELRSRIPIDFLDRLRIRHEEDFMYDQEAFNVLNRRHFSGIFQFNGLALQGLVDQITADEFDDIVSITALARPGPLASGGANNWVKRKAGAQFIDYPHPVFVPYLEGTKGIVLYQEQVMEIGRQIGDLGWDDVTALRKAMSKSLGKEFFDKYGDRFKEGARKKGIPEGILNKVWDDLCAYGAWAFNKSHSVAYGIVSYYCCWLKAHYPIEFAAATLSHETDPDKQIQTLRELASEGIDYIPVDKEISTDKWQVDVRAGKKILIGPVQNVRGIGPKMVDTVVRARADKTKLPDRVAKLLSKPVTPIDSLFPIRDQFAKIMPDPAARQITTPPTPVASIEPNGQEQTVVVFVVAKTIRPRDENDLQKVASRGYEVKGPSMALNMQLQDDSGTIFAKVSRFDYDKIGQPILDRGFPGKAMYAIKGSVPKDFRMVSIKMVRYIGMMDDEVIDGVVVPARETKGKPKDIDDVKPEDEEKRELRSEALTEET
jgi:DNA polymerase III alpha subunit